MKETDEPEARATEPASLEAQQRRNDPAADAGAAGESTMENLTAEDLFKPIEGDIVKLQIYRRIQRRREMARKLPMNIRSVYYERCEEIAHMIESFYPIPEGNKAALNAAKDEVNRKALSYGIHNAAQALLYYLYPTPSRYGDYYERMSIQSAIECSVRFENEGKMYKYNGYPFRY